MAFWRRNLYDVEGDKYKIELVASPDRGSTYVASSVSDDWFSAIDQACDKVERQLRKAKEKITSHRVKKYREPRETETERDSSFNTGDRFDIGAL